MKWVKCLPVYSSIYLFGFLLFAFTILFSHPVNAAEPFSVYWRSYSVSGNVTNDSGYKLLLENQNSLLLLTEGVYKQLYGYSIEFPVTDDLSFTNKKLQVEFVTYQYPSPYVENNSLSTSIQPLYLEANTSTGTKQSTACNVRRLSEASVRHSCELNLSDSATISYAQIVRGTIKNATSSSPVMGITCGTSVAPSCNADIFVTNVNYLLTGSNSPEYEQGQTIISQNQTIINQNQQIIDQDQQDREDVQSASDSGQDNADSSQQQNEQATSTLLSVIGSFIQALGAPASNCQVRTDLGNIDLGTLDFCAGKPDELTPIINTVCAIVMCIPIYLIARDLFRRFVYITTFAQGGEYK